MAKKTIWLYGCALTCAAILPAGGAMGAEAGQSPYVKGYGDVMAGVLPPEPGFYTRTDLIYYTADIDRTVLNGAAELGFEMESVIFAPAISYVTGAKILGGQYAFGILPTLMDADVRVFADIPAGRVERSDNLFDIGDIAISPIILGWHNPNNTHWTVSVNVLAPTGDYDITRAAHTSLNYWAVIPQAGFTWMDPESGWDISFVAAYTLPFENQETDYQSGQIFHLDASVSKEFGGVRLGAVGYVMAQVTGDSGYGAVLGDYKSQVFALGPLISTNLTLGGTAAALTAKWHHEFSADNTFEGDMIAAHIAFKF